MLQSMVQTGPEFLHQGTHLNLEFPAIQELLLTFLRKPIYWRIGMPNTLTLVIPKKMSLLLLL
nr:P6 [Potato leafroll virus]